jgi:hypothetical protein
MENGIMKNGIMKNGIMKNGIMKSGIMKSGIWMSLLCLAMIPAYAQSALSQDRPTTGETAATQSPDYADRVDGLLRDIHATLQEISGRVEAGEITPDQGRALKLAATRAMIARLEAVSAVYDARIESKDNNEHAATVSVEELRRETADQVATSSHKSSADTSR